MEEVRVERLRGQKQKLLIPFGILIFPMLYANVSFSNGKILIVEDKIGFVSKIQEYKLESYFGNFYNFHSGLAIARGLGDELIPLEKIQRVEIDKIEIGGLFGVCNSRITLVDGKIIEGKIQDSSIISGITDNGGRFSLKVCNAREFYFKRHYRE